MYYSAIPVYNTGPMYAERAICTLGCPPWATVVGLALRSAMRKPIACSELYCSHPRLVANDLFNKLSATLISANVLQRYPGVLHRADVY